jgi:copper transport protein
MTVRRSSIAAVLLATVGLVLSLAAPAAAHASLRSTTPGAGATLRGPVRVVTATFDETVGVSADSLRVYAPGGGRVDVGVTGQRGARTIAARLRPHLRPGTYTVAWHVVSADSHPVSGAFTFSIQHPSRHLPPGAVAVGRDPLVSLVYGGLRFLAFAGLAVVVGGLVFLAVCWPAGGRDPRTRRLLYVGWLVAALTAFGALFVQGVYANRLRLTDLARPSLLSDTLRTPFGFGITTRVILLAVAGIAVSIAVYDLPSLARRPRIGYATGCLILGLCLSFTWSVAGHDGVGRQRLLALAADDLHLTAMACWVGGLAMLLVAALRAKHADAASRAVDVFSPIAGWCVLVLVVTGAYQSWRNVGHWAALLDTTYGRLVLLKVAGLVLLVALGFRARRLIGHTALRSRSRRVGTPDLRTLRLSVTLEAVVVLAVLGVAAALVSTPTGREAYHPVVTATRSFDTGDRAGSVTATVRPARLGAQVVRLTVRDTRGRPYRPVQLTASLTLPSRGVGPVPLRVREIAPGRYRTDPQPVGVAGTWTLRVVVRSSSFDETTVQVPVPIG